MGDRALVLFHNTKGDVVSPVVYLHWGGSDVPKLLVECHALMADRIGDVAYSAARFCGIAHSKMPEESTSLGILNTGRPLAELKADPDFSHGDAGAIFVNVDTWEAEAYGGYGFDGVNDSESVPYPYPVGVPVARVRVTPSGCELLR